MSETQSQPQEGQPEQQPPSEIPGPPRSESVRPSHEAVDKSCCADPPQPQINQSNEALGDIVKRAERWMIFLTSGLLVVAAVQWWTTQGQLDQMIEDGVQTNALLAQNERQIRALQETADAANRAVALAQEADRPWIGLQGEPRLEFIDERGYKMRVTTSFVNSGKSPAKIIEMGSGVNIGPSLTPFYGKDGKLLRRETGQLVLAPGMATTSTNLRDETKEYLERVIAEGKSKVFLYGRVIYEDIRTKKRYETTVCSFSSSINVGTYVACNEYNEAN